MSREKRNFGALLGPNPNATPENDVQETAGRQKGKRSNPDYVQVGAHIPKELHRQVRRRLFDEERDLGDLLTELLQEWMRR
ncbi:hypothetical protein Q0M94_24300 (plasmid) [Deinococcus radiomollis]|uniref:hypothetical protein n=1 Tax=Deinococcus radiomollis TaxID=468916 RepID=UPI003891A605